MIISAKIKCEYCGEEVSIPEKKTTRSFMIAFNKQKRKHDWNCQIAHEREQTKQNIQVSKSVANDAVAKMMQR